MTSGAERDDDVGLIFVSAPVSDVFSHVSGSQIPAVDQATTELLITDRNDPQTYKTSCNEPFSVTVDSNVSGNSGA